MSTWMKNSKILKFILVVLGILSLILIAFYLLGNHSRPKQEEAKVH